MKTLSICCLFFSIYWLAKFFFYLFISNLCCNLQVLQILLIYSNISKSDFNIMLLIRTEFKLIWIIHLIRNIWIGFLFGLHSDDFFIDPNNLKSDWIDPNLIRIRFCPPLFSDGNLCFSLKSNTRFFLNIQIQVVSLIDHQFSCERTSSHGRHISIFVNGQYLKMISRMDKSWDFCTNFLLRNRFLKSKKIINHRNDSRIKFIYAFIFMHFQVLKIICKFLKFRMFYCIVIFKSTPSNFKCLACRN